MAKSLMDTSLTFRGILHIVLIFIFILYLMTLQVHALPLVKKKKKNQSRLIVHDVGS